LFFYPFVLLKTLNKAEAENQLLQATFLLDLEFTLVEVRVNVRCM